MEGSNGLNARRSTWRAKCDWSEAAEEAVPLTVRPGSEVDRVGITAGPSVANPQPPQPVNQDLLPLAIDNRTEELAGAVIDAFDIEPLPPDHPFRTLGNMLANAAYRLRIPRSRQDALRGYRLEYSEVA